MTGTDWAYVPAAEPVATVVEAIVAATTNDERSDLLTAFGTWCRSLDDRELFAATADNVARSGDGFAVARSLAADVQPLDRQASGARVAWFLAWALLERGVIGSDGPDLTIDEHAVLLAGRAGIAVTSGDIQRFRHHESDAHAARREFDRDVLERDLRAIGAQTSRQLAASARLDHLSYARALTNAYDDLTAARRDRDLAEAGAVDAAASRALAQSLGQELERDEWIRARLRAVKSTKAARTLIDARKRLLGRPDRDG
jgi:hypothetical protein